MSSKPKPAGDALDIHAAIRATAERLRERKAFGLRDANELPELAELIDAACAAVAGAVPKAFDFHGRPYYLRVRLALQLEVFAAPGDAEPLVCGASFSMEGHGHAPGH